jgi:hypothetical protein
MGAKRGIGKGEWGTGNREWEMGNTERMELEVEGKKKHRNRNAYSSLRAPPRFSAPRRVPDHFTFVSGT